MLGMTTADESGDPSALVGKRGRNMNHVDSATMNTLWHDFDARDVVLRRVVEDRPRRRAFHRLATG